MHRSTTTNYGSGRGSEEFMVSFFPAASKGLASEEFLGTYNSRNLNFDDDIGKKDIICPKSNSSGQRTVHLIPLLLLVCGFVLWWFSTPVKPLHH
ncbi:UNVERIFIED_CONTAM: hypothetical protein Sindi_0185800 [Sesamum indicum]